MGKIPDDPPQTAPRGLCWLPGVIWAQLGVWVGDPGSGPAHRLPMAWSGCWPRGRAHCPPCPPADPDPERWGRAVRPSEPEGGLLWTPPCDRSWGIRPVCPGGTGLLLRGTSGAGRTHLPARPQPLVGDEPCRAARPPRLGRWRAASSPAHLQTAGPAQPAGRSGLRGAQASLMVVTTGVDPGEL